MNIAEIKKELNGDEKVLESAFKLETLYNKHKFKLWAVVLIAVIYFGGRTLQESMHQAKLNTANGAFLLLEKNPQDKASLKILEENNPALFELFSYAQAVKNQESKTLKVLSQSKNDLIADASAYTLGVINKTPTHSRLYNDLALFQEAYIAIGKGETQIAKEKLELIDERSALARIAGLLKHSMIKAK